MKKTSLMTGALILGGLLTFASYATPTPVPKTVCSPAQCGYCATLSPKCVDFNMPPCPGLTTYCESLCGGGCSSWRWPAHVPNGAHAIIFINQWGRNQWGQSQLIFAISWYPRDFRSPPLAIGVTLRANCSATDALNWSSPSTQLLLVESIHPDPIDALMCC